MPEEGCSGFTCLKTGIKAARTIPFLVLQQHTVTSDAASGSSQDSSLSS